MHDPHCRTGSAQAVFQLQVAARIGGGDELGTCGGDMGEFALKEFIRLLGMGKTVGAGAAAAPIGFPKLN
jgi:hypothetical protein